MGTGRIIPISSSGTCRADRASRPHRVTLAGSAHCRSSTTRMVGRAAHCSVHQGQQLLGQRRLHVRAAVGEDLTAQEPDDGVPPRTGRSSLTLSPSRNGSSGSAWPSSSPAPQKTWQPVSGVAATAARTSADLPMPGSPSISTELPRPRDTSFTSPVSSAISLSRPTRASAASPGAWGNFTTRTFIEQVVIFGT